MTSLNCGIILAHYKKRNVRVKLIHVGILRPGATVIDLNRNNHLTISIKYEY